LGQPVRGNFVICDLHKVTINRVSPHFQCGNGAGFLKGYFGAIRSPLRLPTARASVSIAYCVPGILEFPLDWNSPWNSHNLLSYKNKPGFVAVAKRIFN
jgi:hypothetical protein